MKKMISIAAAFAVLICLTACGSTTTTAENTPAPTFDSTISSSDSPEEAEPAAVIPEAAPVLPEPEGSADDAAIEEPVIAEAAEEATDQESFALTLSGDTITCEDETAVIDGSTITITGGGSYDVTGTLNDGMIIVDASAEDEIELCLRDVSIHSEASAAIYVRSAKKVKLKLEEGTINTLSGGDSFASIDENNIDGVIFAKDDLVLKGKGTLIVDSPAGHGIVAKDDLTIKNGVYEITALGHAISVNDSYEQEDGILTLNAGKDGIHAETKDDDTVGSILITGGTLNITSGDDALHSVATLQIDGGDITIDAAEGIESTFIQINGGIIYISASDDGINAAWKSSAYSALLEINGGDITVVMGSGDTDGIDSNGDLTINGGIVDVTGGSTFDYDGTGTYNGGTLIVNGQEVDTLPNQMMGGHGMRGW